MSTIPPPPGIRNGIGTERRVMTHPPQPQTTTSSQSPIGRRRRARPFLVATLFGAALVLAACSSSGSATSTTATTAAPSSSTASSGGASSGATAAHTISIQNFAFSPSTITVAPGATVTVTNHDQVAHTITSAKGGFNTGDIAAGQSKTFTAPNTPGSYSYICSIHQYMTGTLVVSG